jgi:CheY-like chemotaxis protein
MTVPTPDTLPASNRTILLVDDEQTVREVAKRLLDSLGYAVVTARDGEEAISLFRSSPGTIDLALIDLTMPRMGGEETLRELARLAPGLPLVLMSGYAESDVVPALTGVTLAGYLQKPFRMPALRDMLSRALGE